MQRFLGGPVHVIEHLILANFIFGAASKRAVESVGAHVVRIQVKIIQAVENKGARNDTQQDSDEIKELVLSKRWPRDGCNNIIYVDRLVLPQLRFFNAIAF